MIEANGLQFETDCMGNGGRFALCLHGFPEHKYSWRFQLPLLADLGYRAWAPNLRGYGASSRPGGVAAYDIDHLIADVAGLYEAAEKEAPLPERVPIGHDWGAVISWAVALEKAVPLDKLIIMNVPRPALMAKGLRGWGQLKKSWYTVFFQLPWLPERLLGARGAEAVGRAFTGMAQDMTHFSEEDLKVYKDNASEPGALTAMINYYRAAARSRTMKRLSRDYVLPIDVPTLMVWGEEDMALGKELTYGTEDYVRNLTIRYLPGVSHWVQQEAPHVVNPMVATFLEGFDVPTMEALKASEKA
jgi:pimeloyl-ACP methyl ester carboxylesterase